MKSIPTTKLQLVKIAKKSGKYPLKLRVTFNREQRFYPCNIDLTVDEFTKLFSPGKLNKDYKDMKNTAVGIEAKAVGIIEKMKEFDFVEFEMKFHDRASGDGDVYDLFTRVYNGLIATDRIGSAALYNTVLNSLKAFQPKLSFEEITPDFLNRYETWLQTNSSVTEKSNATSATTVGIYMRHLRSVYNRGISENLVAQESYPFRRNKYTIPTGNNIKKALTINEVGEIFSYQTAETGWERKAKDFWMFSYLCNGMNIMDIAKLKYKDIYNGEIHYERSKTIRTNRGKSDNLISITLLEQTQTIIDTWCNKDVSANNYIFPILSDGMSAVEIKRRVRQFTKNMNDYTKKIALSLGIDKNVTTYVARHSYATVLKRSGATIESISENLGHKSTGTTRSYLASFETESRKKNAQALVAFKLTEKINDAPDLE
jgi:site-specific recombinase XerD